MRAVGYGMVTACAVLWGMNGPVSRMILDAGIEPRQLVGWRIMAAAIVMTVVLVVLRRMRWRCSRRAFGSIVLFGLFGVALSMIIGGVFWLLLPTVRELPTDLLQSDVPFGQLDFTVPMLVLIAYVVIGGTIAPYALLVAGINRIGPVAAGVTGMIEPLVAITLGWALLGQSLTPVQAIGIVIVLAAVLASERARSRGIAVAA